MDEKTLFGDVIYQIHKKYSFYGQNKMWSSPFATFSASTNETISQKAPKFIEDLKNKKIIREDIEDLICILGDWYTVAEGIFFTTKAIYINSPKNQDKKFRVRYDDIVEIKHYLSIQEIAITVYDNKTYYITTKIWDVSTIKKFLEFSSAQYNYSDSEREEISNLELPHFNNKKIGEMIAGLTFGNVSNGSTLYGEKFHANRGHGFAAERVNHLYDKITGHDAKIVGDDNAKNGADRLVDGVQIQDRKSVV